jgi:predicted TIM-barrel fold metal-dependent hydrolase
VELAQKYPNVYFDISQSFSSPDHTPHGPHRGLAEEDAVRIMRKIGIERIMFGTDGPAVPIEPQMQVFLRLPLTDDERQMILAENAKRILKI